MTEDECFGLMHAGSPESVQRGVTMYKLILHHSYEVLGEGVDLSGYGNHGFRTNVAFQSNGRTANSGALVFSGGPSRVRVTNKNVWGDLAALKIEMWVKLTALGQRRNLVEGDSNFAFFIHPDGVLWGTYFGRGNGSSTLAWVGANSDTAFSPDGVKRTVPLNTWTKLTYLHDGIATIRLFINDQLVGINTTLTSGIRPTGPQGVHIGHWPGDDRYTFAGEIDEVKIWKYDPDIPQREFFCRPLEADQVDCWGRLYNELARLMKDRERGEQVRAFIACLWDAQNTFIRAIRSKGQAVIEELDKRSQEYMKLWCAGDLGGTAMMNFIADWMQWVNTVAPGALDKYQSEIQTCIKRFKMEEMMVRLGKDVAGCDPLFAAMIEGIAKLVSGAPPQPIQVTGVSPTQMKAGTGGTLTINGANFTASTRVDLQNFGGLATTFVSAARLDAVVPATVAAGSYPVRLSDAGALTGTGFTLTVTPASVQPQPSIFQIILQAILDLLRSLFGGRK